MGFTKITDYDAYQYIDVVRLARYEFGMPKAMWLSEDDKCVVFLERESEWPRNPDMDTAVIGVFDGGPRPTATFRQIQCARDGTVSFVLLELMRLVDETESKQRPTAKAILFRNALVPVGEKRRLVDLSTYARYKADQEKHGVR